jgi:hypothetical protein
MTSSGTEPATFRLVTYCLNQLRYCVPSRIDDRDNSHVSIILSCELHFYAPITHYSNVLTQGEPIT